MRVNNRLESENAKKGDFLPLTKITKLIKYIEAVARQLPGGLVTIKARSLVGPFPSPVWLPGNGCISSMGGICGWYMLLYFLPVNLNLLVTPIKNGIPYYNHKLISWIFEA